ncbi:uncharacterized protein LOC132295346 [Cornus florida]|uniref:uncharacterized protein LOC132295346 n=1 Tax=Cornus florida TaxID=4283 RepID=UPI00289C4794|nr:uncharacterized protein LOC132295346 [Cornus florida]
MSASQMKRIIKLLDQWKKKLTLIMTVVSVLKIRILAVAENQNAENENVENDEFGNIEIDDEELDDVSLYSPSDELWSIHSESDDEEINSAPKQPKTRIARDERNKELVIGMKLVNAKEFKAFLREHAIANRYDIRFKKNERTRVTATYVNGCGWRIHASFRGNGSFKLSTIKPHNPDCPEVEINKQATSTYIAKKYVHKFRKLPEWKNDGIEHYVADNLEIEVSRFKVMRAKRKALQIIEGHHEDQFSKIRVYFALIMKTNPGSVCKVKAKLEPDGMSTRFERVFFSLNTMWRGFKEGCRPFIGLDGCFLKTPYNQILLSAVGRDGDSSFYPIALAVVEAETKDSWDWFIEELMAVISPHKAITWILDRQKGLVDTFASLDGGQDHRFYVRHLHENFKKKYPGMELKQMVWNAANAFNKPEFKKHMQNIRELNGEAYDWLCRIPFRFWTTSKFTDSSQVLS